MRLKHLQFEYLRERYEGDKNRVAEFQPLGQTRWYFHANDLSRLSKVSYALGNPLDECRSSLRHSAAAYRELFALRGTSFYTQTKFKNGEPLGEERIATDGYTSVDSFN